MWRGTQNCCNRPRATCEGGFGRYLDPVRANLLGSSSHFRSGTFPLIDDPFWHRVDSRTAKNHKETNGNFHSSLRSRSVSWQCPMLEIFLFPLLAFFMLTIYFLLASSDWGRPNSSVLAETCVLNEKRTCKEWKTMKSLRSCALSSAFVVIRGDRRRESVGKKVPEEGTPKERTTTNTAKRSPECGENFAMLTSRRSPVPHTHIPF